MTEVTQKEGNNIVFKVLLPCLIFKNIFYTDFEADFDGSLVLYALFTVFLQYTLATVLAFAIEKRPKTRGAIIHSVFRTNSLIIGLAILINLYGDADLGSSSMAFAVIIPIINCLVVFTLEKYRGGKVSAKHILHGIATNPIIVATVIALLLRLVGISNFPSCINSAISSIAALTTPMALLFLGASVEMSKVKDNKKNLACCLAARLIVLPAIVVTIAALIGFRGINLATILTISGGPTAVTAYTMSVSMDSDADLTGEMVAFTTVLSCFSMFLWLFLLMQLSLI